VIPVDIPATVSGRTPLAALPFTVSCPSCRAAPGDRCATRLRRGYHLSRADRAVRAEQRGH
jgi:hypothetical protein